MYEDNIEIVSGLSIGDNVNFLIIFKMAIKSIFSNKLRTFLTMLGVIIGVASVIAAVGFAKWSTSSITSSIETTGTLMIVLGGILGIGIGCGVIYIIGKIGLVPAVYSIEWILISFGVSLGIGLIFGLFPAYKAASMNPIEALRAN